MAVIRTPDNIFHQLSGELHALRLVFYTVFSLIVAGPLCSLLQGEEPGWFPQRCRLANWTLIAFSITEPPIARYLLNP